MNSADAVTWMRSDFRRAPRDSDARPSEEPGGAHEAARELPHLLSALSLDPDALERADDPRLRQMQSTCAGCDRKQRCREDLCLGVAAKRYRLYCPNAGVIAALRDGAWWQKIAQI